MTLYPASFHADSDSTFMPGPPEYEELMSTLENIRTSQIAQELPSISAITRFLLYNFAPRKRGSDEVAHPQSWHPNFDENGAAENSVSVGDFESLDNEEGRDIVQTYISDLLSPTPPTEEESLSKLLGYTVYLPRNKFSPAIPFSAELREMERREREIHLQRARDILGPEIWDMKERCEEIGIFHSELSVDQFFELVNGNTELEDMKRAVELKMRHFIAMVEENPHVFSAAEQARAREMKSKLGVKWEVGEREE
jgi:hypothetical protein